MYMCLQIIKAAAPAGDFVTVETQFLNHVDKGSCHTIIFSLLQDKVMVT